MEKTISSGVKMGTNELMSLTKKAQEYRVDAQKSLERNRHMNEIECTTEIWA